MGLKRLFSRQSLWVIIWIICLGTIGLLASYLGIRFAGDADKWQRFLDEYYSLFFMWRVCLYTAMGYAWLCVRHRVLKRAGDDKQRYRLYRAEISTVLVILILEITSLLS